RALPPRTETATVAPPPLTGPVKSARPGTCVAVGLGAADVVAPAFVAGPPPVPAVGPGVAAAAYGDTAAGVAIVLAISSPTPSTARASSVMSGVLRLIPGSYESQKQQGHPPARRNDDPGPPYVSTPAPRIAVCFPSPPFPAQVSRPGRNRRL